MSRVGNLRFLLEALPEADFDSGNSSFNVVLQFGWLREITSVITEPKLAIIHFKNTRKLEFACIVLLQRVFWLAGSSCDLFD